MSAHPLTTRPTDRSYSPRLWPIQSCWSLADQCKHRRYPNWKLNNRICGRNFRPVGPPLRVGCYCWVPADMRIDPSTLNEARSSYWSVSALVWSDVDLLFKYYLLHLVSLMLPFIPCLLLYTCHISFTQASRWPRHYSCLLPDYFKCGEYDSGLFFGFRAWHCV